MPSDALIAKLASIAVNAQDLLAGEHPASKAPVGVQKLKDDRRRTAEKILVLLADPEVRAYLKDVRSQT